MKTIYIFALLTIATHCCAQQPLLLPCLVGEKWGYCDTNGVVIIPAEFDQAEYFTNKVRDQKQVNFWYAFVRKGKDVNWINADGRALFSFDSIRQIECYPLNEKLWALSLTFMRPTNGFDRIALINKNMDIIRPFEVAQYSSNSLFFDYSENFLMKRLGYQGIINAKGEVLIEPQYVNVSNIWQNKYIALPHKSDKWFFYEMPGEIIDTLHYYPLSSIYNGLIGVYKYIPGIEGASCGFVNTIGKTVVPLRYKEIHGYENGIGLGKRQDNGWDLLDTIGNIRMQIKTYEDYVKFSHHFFIKQDSGGWQGYDYSFKPFLPGYFKTLPVVQEAQKTPFYCFKIGDDSVYMDLKGRELARHSFDYIQRARMALSRGGMYDFPNLFNVRKKGKYGLASRVSAFHFKEIAAPKFDQIVSFRDGYSSASIDGKWGILDTFGQVIIPFKWGAKTQFVYNYKTPDSSWIQVEQNDRIGVFDLKGKLLIPCVLQRPWPPLNIEGTKVWIDSMNGVTYLCNGNGDCKTFDSTYHFTYPFFMSSGWQQSAKPALWVEKGGKNGLLNAVGEWILPPLYFECDITEDGKHIYFFDTSGYSLSERYSGKLLFKSKDGNFRLFFQGNDILRFDVINNQLEYSIWHPKKKVFLKPPYPINPERWGGLRDGMLQYYEQYYDNYKVGFLDENMAVAIPAQFDEAVSFQGGISIVKKSGRTGVIDKTGKILIPLQNKQVLRLSGKYLMVQRDSLGTWDLLNSAFQTIYSEAAYIDTFTDNKFIVWPSPLHPGKRKLLDGTGSVIIPEAEFIYQCTTGLAYLNNGVYFEYGVSGNQPLKVVFEIAKTYPINDSLLLVSIPTSFDHYENLAYGVLKKDSIPFIPIAKHWIKYIKQTGDFAVSDDTHKYALFYNQGKQKTPFQFDHPPEFDIRAPFCYFSTKGYTSTWITRSGRVICQRR